MPIVSPIVTAVLSAAAASQSVTPPVLVVMPEAMTDDVVVAGDRSEHAPTLTPYVRSRDIDLGGIIAALIGGEKAVVPSELTTEQRLAAEPIARR